ncbi:uncharacterized protein LOC133930623 [Phragmites australis]|uniref:uncharacterized protein LOC133930623 n=1 Tax=Phragmites australis TaxID=29695 RepID=UPI002D769DB5|nr:uncharacterized protein LOC133930623 [Phragmites australis]
MELRMSPASPPPPSKDFRLDSAATSPYATAPSSPHGRLGTSPFGGPAEGAAGSAFLTAPPSPNPFDVLPPSTPHLTGANPFDLFHHFTSAPASPRRTAAIYAHFAEGNGRDGEQEQEGDVDEFQPRASFASAVPFDWEERPGTPKRGLGGGGAANGVAWDTDFEFGTFVDKSAPAGTLTTADELFEQGKIRPLKPLLRTADEPVDKGRIRPLKPPPGLLDGGSVGSSPRSPITRAGMWSPQRRSRVGSSVDFDPFTAALVEATKVPSPLGGKEAAGDVSSGSLPKKPTTRPASRSAGWRRWRLSDLLLFRSSSEGGRVNKDPIFKPVQQLDVPVKKASAQPTTTAKANDKGDDMGKAKEQGNRSAAAAAEGVAGCARLSPLQRLAKGLGSYSWHYGRGMAAPGAKG